MKESGDDAFAGKTTVRNPDASEQGDGSGDQTSASSGTTGLGGEPPDGDERVSPGGVEGERDTR